ncbi:MAG: Ig-like domain-containing protein [Caldilineaceae bacterium]
MHTRWMPPAILAVLTCLLVGQFAVAVARPLAQSAADGKLVSPPHGAVFAAGEAIMIEMEMGQDAALERVEFYANGDLITTLLEAPWRYVWQNAPSGVYTLAARGVSDSGAASVLGRAQVLVQRASQPGEPVPPSPVIIDVSWAPTATITRIGVDSDNWTPTWADDGHLYSGYGDGKGFEPKLLEKISMGFGRISGSPPNVVGTNMRSADEQPYGGGANGKKNSGLLMVDNVLYMWVRNVVTKGKGCQLAWSTDHAQSWQWSDWLFADFGYCAFLNFGPNYAGARDDYVYMVTPDGPSAYVAYQDFVLTRVPKTQIANRYAYEFLRAVDENNDPIWTADIAQRGAVFSTVGAKAGRSGMVYNAALGRYLWWQGINVAGPDERYEGGFGVYDAPEPWGPWTVVYYTDLWDHPPGAVGTFPTKWMSDDGRTLYLAFDANDGPSPSAKSPCRRSTHCCPAAIHPPSLHQQRHQSPQLPLRGRRPHGHSYMDAHMDADVDTHIDIHVDANSATGNRRQPPRRRRRPHPYLPPP